MSDAFAVMYAEDDADLAAVAALFRDYAASLAVDLAYQDFAAELASLPGKYSLPAGRLFLARGADGNPLGCVALRPMQDPGRCEMKRLYVAPTGRGIGLGRRLAEAAVEAAREIGYAEIWLDTLLSMRAAQDLYERMGFRDVEPYYDTPVAGTRFMRMGLRQ